MRLLCRACTPAPVTVETPLPLLGILEELALALSVER